MKVEDVIDKIQRARNAISREYENGAPDSDQIDIIEEYIDMLKNLKVKE